MTNFTHFDAAEYLETEEDIALYLEEASKEGDPNAIALFYKAISPGGNPSLETIAKIAATLGFKLALRPDPAPIPKAKTPARRKEAQPEAA